MNLKCIFSLVFACYFCFAEPPKTIPSELYDAYTMNGVIPVSEYYFDNTYPSSEPLVYAQNQVSRYMKRIHKRKTFYYGPTDEYLYKALDIYKDKIQGKTIGIIGSVTPLYESIILSWGGYPVTIDYNKIISKHPQIKTMTTEEYEKNPILFDAIVSISSIEHDGLGRYGDPLNPDGDIFAMSKLKTMLKDDGICILAVPVGLDHIFWNAHRVYGRLRLPLLLQDWDVVDSYGYTDQDLDIASNGWHQPIFVLIPK